MDAAIKTTQFFHLFSFIRQYQFQMREERVRERKKEAQRKYYSRFYGFRLQACTRLLREQKQP